MPPPPPASPDVRTLGRALPPRALPRGRRHGRGVGRHRHRARPPGRGEDAQAGAGVGPPARRAVPAGGGRRGPPLPPVDRRRVRHRGRRRRRSRRDGAGARARRCASASTPTGGCRSGSPSRSASPSPTPSPPPTASRIVHRDIKPGNVLLDPEGRILLTDFGIAKALQQTDDLTSDDVLMGTAKYLSPEQVLGLPVDSRADLYSLGVLLYECLAGQPPFVADTQAATAMARLQRDPVPVRKLRPGVPRALDDLVMELLARDADDRPRNAALVRDALMRLLETVSDEDATVVVTRDSTPEAGSPLPRRAAAEDATTPPTRAACWPSARRAATSSRSSCCARSPPSSSSPARCSSRPIPAPGSCARRATSSPASRRRPRPRRPRRAAPPPAAVVSSRRVRSRRPAATAGRTPSSSASSPTAAPTRRGRRSATATATWRPKPGVGLVFQLSAPAAGHTLVVTSPTTGGWDADVYVSDATHPTLDGWGTPVASTHDAAGGPDPLRPRRRRRALRAAVHHVARPERRRRASARGSCRSPRSR